MTIGRSFVLRTSAAECNARAIPCLPSQPPSTLSSPDAVSRMYKENNVDKDSWHLLPTVEKCNLQNQHEIKSIGKHHKPV